MRASAQTRELRRRQTGSAFVVVLMVLIVLTFIGLGLSLMTESEVNIGWNERLGTRMLYAADSGTAIAVARNDGASLCGELDVNVATAMPGSDPAVLLISPYLPINNAPCNLCDIHVPDASSSYNKKYERINHLIGTEAVRSEDTEPGQFGFASHIVTAMVDVMPAENALVDCKKTADTSSRDDLYNGGSVRGSS